MRFLKVKVFSILVDRICKVKYDSLKVCSKMFRHFVGGSSYLRILNASTIRNQICSFPICDFASSQQFHQLHNSPVFVCFRSISLIFFCDQFYSDRSSQFLWSKLLFEVKNVIRIHLLKEMCHCS